MKGDEIIDIDVDPREHRRAFWRRLLRYGVPLAAIALITAGLIASTLYTNAMNREDVLGLSRDFIDALNDQVYTELRAYLGPAQSAVGSLSAALPDQPWSGQGRDTFERMGLDILNRDPQLSSVYFGTPAGQFIMVRRNSERSADTKRIERMADEPGVTWSRRDQSGRIVDTESDPEDRYDPRSRGWYQDAQQNSGIRWSKVYTFFTNRTPGITASMAVDRSTAKGVAVVGVDIFLNSLSELLESLQTKARGTLAIVNGEGQVIAFHDPDKVVLETDEGLRARTVRELGIPALAEAFDRLRVEGPGRTVVPIDGGRFIFGAASLEAAVSRDWWLLLLAPEKAYLGFVATNSRRGLIASSGIVVLSVILAALLCYQGIAADRNNRAVLALQNTFATYRGLQANLAGVSNLSDPNEEQDLRRASEILARAEAARRISFWRISEDRGLICLDAFESESRGHIAGVVLQADDCMDLFYAICAGEMIEIVDTEQDPRTAAIHLTYFQAVGTKAVYSVPILLAERALGAIWIEDPDAERAVTVNHNLSRTVANLLSARLKRLADEEPVKTGAMIAGRDRESDLSGAAGLPVGPPSREGAQRSISLVEKREAFHNASASDSAASTSVYSGTTVLYLKLLDHQALAAGTLERGDAAIIREIVAAFEAAANSNGIPYVKFLTDQILAVDGFGGEPDQAAERLVNVALEVRDRCAAIFLAAGRGPQFAMGMDSGMVFGAAVGTNDDVFNVWGEGIRIAHQLAETTEPGSIQVSETAYERLRESCVFRRRSAFYFDQVGEMTTFSLRGRT